MAISAKRFELLDKETNVAVSSFLKTTSSGPLNTPVVNKTEITETVTTLIEGNKNNDLKNQTQSVSKTIDASTVRQSINTGELTDTGSITLKEFDALMNQLFSGNDAAKISFRQLSESLKTELIQEMDGSLANETTIKTPYTTTTSNLTVTDIFGLSSLIDKLAGSVSDTTITNTTNITNLITALIIKSYKMGLTGTFTTLSSLITNDHTLIKIADAVLLKVIPTENMWIVIDIGMSRVGGTVRSIHPYISSFILRYFKIPDQVTEDQVVPFFESFSAALKIIDPNWDHSSELGLLSITNMTYKSAALKALYDRLCFKKTPTLPAEDGVVIEPTDEFYLTTALAMPKTSTYQQLTKDFIVPINIIETQSDYVPLSVYLNLT